MRQHQRGSLAPGKPAPATSAQPVTRGCAVTTTAGADDGSSWGQIFLAALVACAVAASGDLVDAVIEQRQDAWTGVAIVVAILVSSLVANIAGFAFSALAGSALAYLKMDPVRAVQAMALCSIATQLYSVWQLRASIRWQSLWPMTVAGAATIPFGVWLLIHIAGPAYGAGLGVFLILYGCHFLSRRKARAVRGSAWRDALAGALGGIAGGLAGLPGAFVTIWCSMRGWDKLRQRAVYQPYILAMQIVTIVCLRWAAPAQVDATRDARLVPFALLGAIGGLALFRRMTNNQFQWIVSALLVVSGIGLLARAI